MIISVIGQGLLWSILGIGIYLTYRLLNFPDMTAEGSFPLGGAVCVSAITHGVSPLVATILGMVSGMLVGGITGLLYTKGKIPVILAGILVMSSCNSLMLFVMKRPNLSLLNQPTIFSRIQSMVTVPYLELIIFGLIFVVALICLLSYFFQTEIGQAYLATGDNETMARSLGIHTDAMKMFGLMCSNGFIALAGALLAQMDGFADVSKGLGIIVIGLSAIIIGEVLYKNVSFTERLIAIVVGSIIYQLIILALLKVGVDTTYLKFFSASLLAACLIVPQFRHSFTRRG